MTAKLIKSILVTVVALTLTCGLATAGEKMKVYEMGESGQNVSFPMSAEEIQRTALRDAQEAAQRTARKNMRANKPNVPVDECKLCESGEIITFVKTHSAN